MPITQPPTLNIIDRGANQFIIAFGVQADDNDPSMTLTVPNLFAGEGNLYTIDFASINTPGRGNIPAIRSLGFSIANAIAGPAPNVSAPIYVWNPETNQVLAICPQAGLGNNPASVMGMVPFYCKPTQKIQIFRDYLPPFGPSNSLTVMSFIALTFDAPAYLTSFPVIGTGAHT